MPNCPNRHVLENIVGKFVPATVTGELIGADWSASMGYPGIKLDPNGDTAHDYLFYSNNFCDNGDYLNHFEGDEFARTSVTVERYDELDIDTCIYPLKNDRESLLED